MIASLAQRQLEGELMDDPAVDADAHVAALRGLRRINRVSRTAATLWPSIARIAQAHRGGALSLLDVATGGGDVPLSLWRRARRHGLALDISACDISETALGFATAEAARAGAPIRFFRLDVLTEPLTKRYDVITTSLFLHHLTDTQIVALLNTLAAQADHLVISDLIRSRTGYGLALLGTRLLSGSRIVHVDGLKSVRAALTLPEAHALAATAGLDSAVFERRWPRRFLMTWSRPGPTAGRHEP
ncbi:MAG TPA: methyltransferase domain-containing protein [Gammaproteobacteria bacterium]|nr:methyltransferase domain-containing protein [Gammaproteobacteria bacterium]